MSVLQRKCRTGATGAARHTRATAARVASVLRWHARAGAGPAHGRAPAAAPGRRRGRHQAGRGPAGRCTARSTGRCRAVPRSG
ncbi:hypothetical protein G6F50_017795 [Rhizopus delemar]|uniref:Uncharacterized protein n=1 Tax=Rhizopus delemar TaxID=936053 RepID=A0A9P6XP15_9FUNG|nr:hypothetical protein G6F50_017795 [Rhizopus delemar]